MFGAEDFTFDFTNDGGHAGPTWDHLLDRGQGIAVSGEILADRAVKLGRRFLIDACALPELLVLGAASFPLQSEICFEGSLCR